jgi:hypothetical protein
VQANNGTTSGKATVDGTASCGWPAAGAQYARLVANGPIAPSHPAATPVGRPLALNVTEIRVPVPTGATGVSFRYEFWNREIAFGPPSAQYNDGLEIAVVAADDVTILQACVYVDTFSALAPGGCIDSVSSGTETGANGPDSFSVTFGGAIPAGAYLSVACWNSNDNSFNSGAAVDCVAWGSSFELGNISGPRVVDLSPATSFKIGQQTSVQMQAGLPFLEGSHCMVVQVYDGNFATQVPGIAGDFYLSTDRPVYILSDGLLTGGAFPGRGPVVNATINDPSLCGVGLVIQSYVITEQLTNPTWTTALFGWIQ